MEIDKILDADGYFLCEKYSCKMSVADCVRRQKKIANWYANPLKSIAVDPGCVKCEQGGKNMEGIIDGFAVSSLCECGKEASQPHNAKNPKFCRECWGKIAGRKPRGKYKPRQKPDAPEPTDTIEALPDEKKENRARGEHEGAVEIESIVIIDFSRYTDLLENLKKEANNEVRTIEQQILYVLKTRKEIKEITS